MKGFFFFFFFGGGGGGMVDTPRRLLKEYMHKSRV